MGRVVKSEHLVGDFEKKGVKSKALTENNPAESLSYIKPANMYYFLAVAV